MADVGLKISAASYNALTAPDYGYVYNSDWPSLACAFDALVTVSPSATVTIPHGLKMYPLVMGWVIVGGVNVGRIFAVSQNFEIADSYTHYPQVAISLYWDTQNVYVQNNDGSGTYQVCVKCYNLDITSAVNYTNPKPAPAKVPYSPDFGIKIAKYGKDLRSKDLRDFILHSRAQSPALLSTVTGNTADVVAISYNNPVGYVPWTFAFYQSGNYYFGLAPGQQQAGALFKLGQNISFSSVTVASGAILTSTVNTNLSLVVLRDPLIAANTVNASY